MTHQELTDFYNYAGLPFSRDAKELQLLKKQLLLELKGANADTLVINGKSYSRNDITAFFDAPQLEEEEHSEIDDLLEKFPVLKKIRQPESIFIPLNLPAEAASHPAYDAFRIRDVEPVFGKYLRELETAIKTGELQTANGLLSFIKLFSDDQQYKAASTVKILFRGIFARVRDSLGKNKWSAIKEEKYFSSVHYCGILLRVTNDDEDFLMEQLDIAEDTAIRRKNATFSTEVYRLQYKLALPESVREHILANIRQLESSGSSSSSGSSGFDGRWAWLIVSVIIIVLRVILRSSGPSTPDHVPQFYVPPVQLPVQDVDSSYLYKLDSIQTELDKQLNGIDLNTLDVDPVESPNTGSATIAPQAADTL